MWLFNKEENGVKYIKNFTRFISIMFDLLIIMVLLHLLWSSYIAVVGYFYYVPLETIEKNTLGMALSADEAFSIKVLNIIIAVGILLELFVIYLYMTWMWCRFSTTPGKFLFGARIVDARTLKKITFKQASIRFFGVILSFLPMALGIIWSIFDRKSQALHDKLAKTVVIIKNVEY